MQRGIYWRTYQTDIIRKKRNSLYDSLENASEHIVKAANGIIKNYLLPHDVSGMTEEQRRDRIAFGLEKERQRFEKWLKVE